MDSTVWWAAVSAIARPRPTRVARAGALVLAFAATLGAGSGSRTGVTYTGRWEVVRDVADGRYAGGSVRSYHPWDSLNFVADGRSLRIYGVTGPTGGRAVVAVAGLSDTVVDFFSPQKQTHVLVYASPPLEPGPHAVALIVTSSRDPESHGNYVNVDRITVDQPANKTTASALDAMELLKPGR